MTSQNRKHAVALLLVFCAVMLGVFVPDAYAAECNTNIPAGDNELGALFESRGMITSLLGNVTDTLDTAWQDMYNAIIVSRLTGIVGALMLLYVVIFSAMYTIGMVQMPLNEVIKRVIKLSIVGLIISNIDFFNDYIYRFFRDGGAEILALMVQEVTYNLTAGVVSGACADVGGYAGSATDPVLIDMFLSMDMLVCELLKPSTLMILEAALNSPPWGVPFAATLIVGGVFLVGALARALWLYIISVIAVTFLFAIAPVFFAFILFERTKPFFNAWVAQTVNFTLQPIMMFAFMSFFVVMMHESLNESILGAEVCYGPVQGFADIESGPAENMVLQFSKPGSEEPYLVVHREKPYCLVGGQLQDCNADFDLDIIGLLTFALLAYMAFQFYNHVVDLCNDISGSFINLEIGSPIQQAVDTAGGMMSNAVNSMMSGGDNALQNALNPLMGPMLRQEEANRDSGGGAAGGAFNQDGGNAPNTVTKENTEDIEESAFVDNNDDPRA